MVLQPASGPAQPPEETPAHARVEGDPVAVALLARLAAVPLNAAPKVVAGACLDAVQEVLGCTARLVVPMEPMGIAVGGGEEGLTLAVRFAGISGEAELWLSDGRVPGAGALQVLLEQLERIWAVQHARAANMAEADRLRFQLAALQQVARTLAVVRRTEETERLALDSVGEVFFAWWAALYRREEERYICHAVRSLRGESVVNALPAELVDRLVTQGGPPVAPPRDAEIRDYIHAEIALIAPLDLGEGMGGLLVLGPRMTQAEYDTHDLALLRALADSTAIALRNADLLDRLRAQATIDPLTGCHNRRGFDEMLAREVSRAQRHERPLSLVVLDIDHFKHINDALGHAAGDHALRRLGRTLRHAFRVSDGACRYGGEEFALILPETAKDEGLRLAERLRRVVEELGPDEEIARGFTISLGVAAFPDDAYDPADLFRAADRALYRAKAQGRNRVVAA